MCWQTLTIDEFLISQITISFLANLSSISCGMGLSFPAITSQILEKGENDVIKLNASQISWFASIVAIACPFGGPISGFLSDKIGRRYTLIVVNIIGLISWILVSFTSRFNVDTFYIQLMIGRALVGLTIGMITTPAVSYIAEISHPKLRGALTVLSTPFFTSFGSLLIFLLGYWIPVS